MGYVGTILSQRFRLFGVKPCERCIEVARKMNANGPDWCERNIDMLTTQIDRNLRSHKQTRARLALLIPPTIRQRWIKRQITLSIKQARKETL